MNLLVAGHDRVDAGKTTFSAGLLAHIDAVGFKPRAGNDFWFDHDDYRHAVDAGRLYGKDAKRLAALSVESVEPEDINPIHRLWRPAPEPGAGLVGRAHRQFVLDRVGSDFVVNAGADVPQSARERLPLSGTTTVDSLEELNECMQSRHLPVLQSLAQRIRNMNVSVVESYGNVALPIQNVVFDAVAVVEPGRARIYDGDRFAKACSVASGSVTDAQLEQRTSDVTALLDPKSVVTLSPLTSDERADAMCIAQAYESAYDALLSAGRDEV